MAVTEVFNEAAERVKQLKEASNADRLCLYGYFKQSTIGDVNIPRPGGLFNQEAKAKFDEWTKRKGVSKEDAMKEYIKKVDELCGTSFESKI
ncbi:hypothetical protein BU14_0488s0012 [Porphyra umbilicalis]|uniref:ACB domain-containing protein n=1 Tax=Porphyra umbilicalis TaxID=2786 RepID=A0A1X6NTX0_PORUM|nr:hypothetical protein BU14_0488s0012 [Porphyra umbilicalis]|eukprot:OSX71950.1 hypothetical protein BU14_0488s0012 [Porphyra umbilicalis]